MGISATNGGVLPRYGHLCVNSLEKNTYYYPETLNLSIKIIIVDNQATMNIILIIE